MASLLLKDIYKVYQSGVVAVTDFTLDIQDKAFIVFVGPSGCGKSTTLRMIAGLEEISDGELYIDGKLVNTVQPKDRDIAMVFQNYALYPHMTVLQNILFPLQNLRGADKLTKDEMLARATEAAKLVQIDELLDRNPSVLYVCQQHLFAIARALVKMPRVLLLDEPLSNLDARLRLQTREEIRRIQRETQITTVFVTHDQEEAMSISDMIVVMKLGVVQQVGQPQAVYDDPINLFVAKFLGTPPINVFEGNVKSGMLYIGDEAVMEVSGAPDGEVYAAVRPEGFILQEDGPFTCRLSGVEVMGRDVSIVSRHDCAVSPVIRAIIGSDNRVNTASDTVRFALKRNKTFIVDRKTEERIRFEV